MHRRTMIIVWGWKSDVVPPGEHLSLYTLEEQQCLICADIRKNSAGKNLLHNLINEYTAKGSVLLFLHKTEPHFYAKADQSQILKEIDPARVRQVRMRFFGGGTEPLYFGWDSELGILGKKGRFPINTYGPSDAVFEEKKSTLRIEGEKDKIRQEHFDYVWNAYWHFPKQLVYDLAERFRFRADGFELEENTEFLTYLRAYDLLWQQLTCFAAKEPDENLSNAQIVSEYNFDSYELLLKEANPELLKKVRPVREVVKTMLSADPIIDKAAARNVVEKTFNGLFGLFKDIAFVSA